MKYKELCIVFFSLEQSKDIIKIMKDKILISKGIKKNQYTDIS